MLVEAGDTNRLVADHVSIPLGTVARIACRVRSEGTAAARIRPSRPPLVDGHASRRLQFIILGHLLSSLEQVTEDFHLGLVRPVSSRTVRRCLHRMCPSNYAAVTKPFLTPSQVRHRLQWGPDKVHWPFSA